MGLLDPYLNAAALAEKLRGLPPGSVQGILAGESTAPGVVSSAGAITPLQLLPSTLRDMRMDPRFVATHPDAATQAGAAYLSQQYQKFGNLPDAYAAYNAGPGGAQQWIDAGRPASFPVKNGDIGAYANRASAAQGGTQVNGDLLSAFDSLPAGASNRGDATGGSLLQQFDSLGTKAEASPAEGGDPGKNQPPPQPPNFIDSMANAGKGMMNSFFGAVQGTTPVTGNLQGEQAYGPRIGTPALDDAGQPMVNLGNLNSNDTRPIDPSKEVVLYGPDGKLGVYARSAATDIGKLNSIGHLIGIGAMTGDPVPSIPQMIPRSPTMVAGVKAFDQAGIAPSSMAAVTGGRFAQVVHGAMKDFFPTAGPTSRADNAMLQQTGDAARRVAGNYGEAGTNLDAGAALQSGAQAFRGVRRSPDLPPLTGNEQSATILQPTRATSFAQKSAVLYDRVDSMIGPQVNTPMTNTAGTLQRIAGKFDNPELAKAFADPQMAQWSKAIEAGQGSLSWSDARNFRTELGKLIAKPMVLNDQDRAALSSLYGSATKDLQATAAGAGGDAGLLAFKRADQYYSAGAARIKDTVGQILSPTTSDEGAFNLLMRTTKAGSASENAAKLTALRRSIPDEQWGDVAATIVSRLGEPVANAKNADAALGANFSPTTFMTRYNNLSDTAKDTIFGTGRARYEMDNLVSVVNRESGMKKLESASHSAGPGMMMGAAAAAVTSPVKTIIGAIGANMFGRLVTNAGFIRWLGRTAPLKTVSWPQKLAQLGQMAKFDAALQEPFAALAHLAPADQNDGQSR